MWVDNKQRKQSMYMRWVHKPYQMNHAFKHHYWPPFEKFLKKLKGFTSIKSDNEYWLDRPQQTVLSRLILERSSDWSCDWSCNITVMNTCSLVWAVSHTNVVSNTASPEELAAVLQLPFIIAQQSIQIHDFYIKIHSSSFWDSTKMSCHMMSCCRPCDITGIACW